MQPGFGAVAFALLSVALGAFLHVNSPGSLQRGLRGRDWVFQFFDFLRNDPRPVSLERGINKYDANKCKERGEEASARLQTELCVSGHRGQENLRTFNLATKGGEKYREAALQKSTVTWNGG